MSKKASTHPFKAGDTLFPLDVPLEKQSSIRVIGLGGLRFFEEGPEGNREIGAPPNPKRVFIKPRRDTPEREEMMRAANIVAAALERCSNTGVSVADTARMLKAKGFEKTLIDSLIRAFLRIGTLRLTSYNGNQLLKLTKTAREIERRRGYSASFASDLVGQSQQLGRLIL